MTSEEKLKRGGQNKTHGQGHGTPEYRTWLSMKKRCYNEKDKDYPRWGGRGIRVCRRWRGSFEKFYKDMGDRPDGHEIERVDNNGDYIPSNCLWATKKAQARNRRTSFMITCWGQTKCAAEWAEYIGMNESTIRYRIRNGWKPAVAFTRPVQ